MRPSMPSGGRSVRSRARAGCSRRSSRYIVTSSEPTGTAAALDRGDPGGQPVRERHAAGRDAEQDEVVGALGALEDLVGDAGEGPADVGGLEDPAYAGPVRGGWRAGVLRVGVIAADLLPRLSGRVVKGCLVLTGAHRSSGPAADRSRRGRVARRRHVSGVRPSGVLQIRDISRDSA